MNWKLETDLCEAFKPEAFRRGWTLHGETHKWDMMFVDQDGRRLGIQAKLNDPALAVAQCKERMNDGGADVAAILVPRASQTIRRLCEADRIGVIVPIGEPDENGDQRFIVSLKFPEEKGTRCTKPLPKRPRNIPCGVPSPPADFGPWQERECLLEYLLEKSNGRLTKKKCKSVGVDPSFHRLPHWLFKAEGWDRYERVYGQTMPSEKWPEDYERVVNEFQAFRMARA